MRELQNSGIIKDFLRLKSANAIKYGHYMYDDAPIDDCPYWHTWIEAEFEYFKPVDVKLKTRKYL
ncbi:MAG: hypothetical protein LBC56_00500 [Oscillospiraceae bacterium]|jgi:hypothetical protein|nr:hypothetical protein [Oscillospiraceae bacterium]